MLQPSGRQSAAVASEPFASARPAPGPGGVGSAAPVPTTPSSSSSSALPAPFGGVGALSGPAAAAMAASGSLLRNSSSSGAAAMRKSLGVDGGGGGPLRSRLEQPRRPLDDLSPALRELLQQQNNNNSGGGGFGGSTGTTNNGSSSNPPKPSLKIVPPDLKRLVSSVRDAHGPILKFTELFAPHPSPGSFNPRRKLRSTRYQASLPVDSAETDEEDIVSQFEYLPGVFSELQHEDSDDELSPDESGGDASAAACNNMDAGDAAKVTTAPDAVDSEAPSASTTSELFDVQRALASGAFSLVEQRTWENNVLWSDPTPEPEKAPMASEVDLHASLFADSFPPPLANGKTSPRFPPHGSSDRHAVGQSAASDSSVLGHSDALLAPLTKVSGCDSLSNDSWTNQILWNERQAPHLHSNLIVDLNDPRIYPFLSGSRRQHSRSIDSNETQAREEQLDKFNLSNDAFYRLVEDRRVAKRQGRTVARHSDLAYTLSMYKTALSPSDLRDFHRPKHHVPRGAWIKLQPVRKGDAGHEQTDGGSGGRRKTDSFKTKADLSAKDRSRVVLLEYVEQYPLVVQNTGMGSRLRNYYRKRNATEDPLIRFDDGETVLLEPDEESPFFGDIEPGKSIQAIDNMLFRAPIFQHTIPETDFLVIWTGRGALIRRIPTIYTVGQVQPRLEVPAPNSRWIGNFLKYRLQVFIYRQFLKKKLGEAIRLSYDDLAHLFPGVSHNALKKTLRDIASFHRATEESMWFISDQSQVPSEEELRRICPPEDVCLYESMLYGQYRLKQSGIQDLTTLSAAFSNALHYLEKEEDEATIRAARYVEEELQLTPWNLTSSFIAAEQGKGQVKLSGFGDPSGRGEAFSYVRVPMKIMNKPDAEKKIVKNQKKVTGTDSDLRKLDLPAMNQILRNFGIPDNEFKDLTRWQRIGKIRALSSEARASGDGVETEKFARDSRFSLHQQQVQYKEQTQLIFDNQIRALSNPNADSSDDEADEDEESDSELEDFEKDLEVLLERPTEKKRRRQEAEEQVESEKAELERFMKQKALLTDKDVVASPHANKIIRRVITKHYEDGHEVSRVEIINDPVYVEQYIAREEQKRAGVMKLKLAGYKEGKNQKAEARRQQEAVAERTRKLAHAPAADSNYKQRSLQKRKEKKRKLTLHCSHCGHMGHVKADCPSKVDFDGSRPDVAPVRLADDGGKLIFSARLLQDSSSRKRARTDDDDYSDEDFSDDPDLYERAAPARRKKRTGSTGAQVALASLFESIIQDVRSEPWTGAFHRPVNLKQYPDYKQVVKTPMDLSLMRENAKAFKYQSRKDFMADVNLMVANCHAYNRTRYRDLLLLADNMSKLFTELLDQKARELAVYERDVKAETSIYKRTSAAPYSVPTDSHISADEMSAFGPTSPGLDVLSSNLEDQDNFFQNMY